MYRQDKLHPDTYWGSCYHELRSLLDTLKGPWKIEAHPKDSSNLPMFETTHFFSDARSEIGYIGKAYSDNPDTKFVLHIFPANREWCDSFYNNLCITKGDEYVI